MDELISFLVFEDYKIEKCLFNINSKFDFNNAEVSVKPKFKVEHTYENENRVFVSLTCLINENNLSDDSDAFYLEIMLKGIFSIDDKFSEVPRESVHDVINLNTVAILFPYLRSAVTNVTSIANIEPLILPPINIHRLLGLNK
ncbi:protein-export chaperone SecB [Bacillus mesophilum]|uniref:Preprotein translocase subunit SecB n=1 Tax=Bacillus mesophilum TaxID=1071718 RepID=A0A7V7RM47_9BACI|nr:protein-export chaperone SecB [Bacillus mesophilum]KAB2332940.1 hypothetical protein F7732_12730 [Bacillus mesophilum]